MTATTRRAVTGATLMSLVASRTDAQPSAPIEKPHAQDSLLTVFLRHDETKTLGEINEHLKQTGFFKQFPPPGIEVVSWYVMMGIGQVATLNVPPDRLREVNRILEQTAWGGFHTEFYPTYDYRQGAADVRKQMQ
jgi:hypothetical protein